MKNRQMNSSKSDPVKDHMRITISVSFSQLTDLYQINIELLMNQFLTAFTLSFCTYSSSKMQASRKTGQHMLNQTNIQYNMSQRTVLRIVYSS